jgi:hypothetical protein
LNTKAPSSNVQLFSETPEAIEWLEQFSDEDRLIAAGWLDELTIVSADTLRTKLLELIKSEVAQAPDRPVALYIERELAMRAKKPQYAFHQRKLKSPRSGRTVMRAHHTVPKIRLIQPRRTLGPEAGSEVIIANLATNLQRLDPDKYFVNPGPDQIREHRIGQIFILTDFVGSGDRVYKFLDAFWQHPTVKSWKSLKWIRFVVLAYSATSQGASHVREHPSAPEIKWVAACPTIRTHYTGHEAKIIEALCQKYDPIDKDPKDSLGYQGQGVMLVFAHTCPNNAPRFLYKKSRKKGKWRPLFAGRSNTLPTLGQSNSSVRQHRRLVKLGRGVVGNRWALAGAVSDDVARGRLLVLASLKAGYRYREDIAASTGLDVAVVEIALADLKNFGWVGKSNALTGEGHRNLLAVGPLELRKTDTNSRIRSSVMYYPKSLRPPVKR